MASGSDGKPPQQFYRGKPIRKPGSSRGSSSPEEESAREAIETLKRRFKAGLITRFEAEEGRKKILDELERKKR